MKTQIKSKCDQLTTAKLFENSFQQVITTKSKLLDVILTNNTDPVLNVSVDNRVKTLYKSVHLPFWVKLSGQSWHRAEIKRKVAKKNEFTVLSYTRADGVSLSKHIEENPFVPYCLSNVDMMVLLWYEWLYKCFQSHIPTKTRHRMILAPWVSNETSILISKKKTLQKALQKQAIENRRKKLEALNGKIVIALETDQRTFENTVFGLGKFSDFQKYFKSIKKTTQLSAEMFLENEIASTDLEKTSHFIIFAQSVFTLTDYHSIPELKSPMKIKKMQFTQSEIKAALKNLDVAKSKRPDGLGNLPLKKLSNSLCKSLSLVFSTIADKRAYPIARKTSEILPFFKDGDKQSVANYRFISLLSCSSKLLETIIFGKLHEVVKDIIAPEQYGFRKN